MLEESAGAADNERMSTPAPGLRWIPLGQLLVDGRILTEEQLQRALEHKATTGHRLGEVVVELGFTTERAIAGALAEQYELEYVDLDVVQLDKQAIALLPEELARRYEALPAAHPRRRVSRCSRSPTRRTSPRPTTFASLSAPTSGSPSRSAARSTSRSRAPTAARYS